MRSRVMLMVYLLLLGFMPLGLGGGQHDYGKALSKSILYFEAQRSGYLPKDQRITWRANSGLEDGKADGVDLVGGYYDAGDNVKFGLPMAFTITMMSWSIVEYGRQMASSGELGHAMDAVKWGTDYLIKAHREPYVLYAEVGDGYSDHYCWQRPEDMTTSRKAYRLDVNHPGSDLAGETAAAMAAASLVFRSSDPAYSNKLVTHAKQLFEFADNYRGKYDSSISVTKDFYQSYSGYNDELLWAAAWLYQATDDNHYLDYVGNNGDALGGIYLGMHGFWWDVKFAGVQLLATKFLLQGKAAQHTPVFEKYQQKAEYFACANIGKDKKNVRRTPGGLLYRQSWNNLQFVTGASFLLTLHADYLHSSGRNIHCSSGTATPAELLSFAKSQVDYILGDNPRGTSYMVGYGQTYPQQVHHRSASIPSIKVHPAFVGCRAGYGTWYKKKANNPNVLEGAIVGGPDANDNFIDKRENYEQTEAATYNGAPLLGVLARLNGGKSDHSQLLSGVVPLPTQVPVVSQKPNSPSQPVTTKPSFPPSSSSSVSPQRHLAAPRHAPTPHPVPLPTTPPLRWPSLPHPPSHHV